MSNLGLGRHTLAPRNQLGSDSELIEQAAQLAKAAKSNRQIAQRYVFLWLLILATHERTVPGAVVARLMQSQPSRNDQYALVNRLRARLAEEG